MFPKPIFSSSPSFSSLSQTTASQVKSGSLASVTAFFLFSLSDAIIKDVGQRLELIPMVFLGALTSCSTILAITLGAGKLSSLRTDRIGIHFRRGYLFLLCGLTVFYALPQMPLAQFYAINFTMPFWALILALLYLRIPVQAREVFALVVGFSGVLIAISPNEFLVNPGVAVVVLAPILFAGANILSRSVPSTESPLTLAFYPQMVVSSLLLLPTIYLLYSLQKTPLLTDIAMIALSGILQGGAMILLGLAFQRSSPAVAAFAQYSQAIWGGLLGLLFFGEVPGASTIVGLLVIIGAGVLLHKRIS